MDTIFYNGLIRSMDEEGTCYEAIGITGDKISFLGSSEEAAALEAARMMRCQICRLWLIL